MSDKNIPDEMKEQLENGEDNENNQGDLNNKEHELDTENLEMLDPALVEKIQEFGHEDMLVQFDGSGRGNTDDNGLSLAREWFSQEDDYMADTNLSPQQVYALTLLRNVENMFPNKDLSQTQSWVDSVIGDLEKYLISVGGMARKQEENVLRAIFGDGGNLSADEKDSLMMRMLSNPNQGDDE